MAGCLRLLGPVGGPDDGGLDDGGLLLALGGPAARPFLDGQRDDDYWVRVWALRGLLWAGDGAEHRPAVRAAVARALDDEAWRVREMAVRVAGRHRLGDLTSAVADLRADPVPRVAAAATRALPRLAGALP